MNFIWETISRIFDGAVSVLTIICQTGVWVLIIGGTIIGIYLAGLLIALIIGIIQTIVSSKKDKKNTANHCTAHIKKY